MKREQLLFDVGCFVICVCAAVIGCATVSPRDRNTADEFLRQYAIGLHGAFSEAAAAVEQGGVKTDAELLEFLQPRTESARKEAAATIDNYMESNISDGELKKSDATALRNLATQFRGAP